LPVHVWHSNLTELVPALLYVDILLLKAVENEGLSCGTSHVYFNVSKLILKSPINVVTIAHMLNCGFECI